MILSYIICTYRRNELIYDCVSSVVSQLQSDCELIIVDNSASDKHHKELVEILGKYISRVRIIREDKVGLSYARNTGLRHAQGDWVALVDDDALLGSGYTDCALATIQGGAYDCFGGHIESWWRYGRPRWLADDYGSKPLMSSTMRRLEQDEYVWGSNILINREAALDVGGFPEGVGMAGNRIGYSAENIIQDKLRAADKVIGYHPDLVVQHLVNKPKLRLSWHLKSAYATGRDGRAVFADQYGMLGMLRSLKTALIAPIKSLVKWIAHSDYYWENAYLDTLKPVALLIGKIRSIPAT